MVSCPHKTCMYNRLFPHITCWHDNFFLPLTWGGGEISPCHRSQVLSLYVLTYHTPVSLHSGSILQAVMSSRRPPTPTRDRDRGSPFWWRQAQGREASELPGQWQEFAESLTRSRPLLPKQASAKRRRSVKGTCKPKPADQSPGANRVALPQRHVSFRFVTYSRRLEIFIASVWFRVLEGRETDGHGWNG